MYRITIYPRRNRNEKRVSEFRDEDELRDAVDGAINDIENKTIKTFMVSWLSDSTFTPDTPFWEKEE